MESKRDDRLYDDPLAETLAGPKAMETANYIASGKGTPEVRLRRTLFARAAVRSSLLEFPNVTNIGAHNLIAFAAVKSPASLVLRLQQH